MTYSANDDDDDEYDREATEQAARARQLGTSIVRSHLQTHLHNNPDSSFVTWIATLHPENASITIDDRFFFPGNPWQMVYEEVMEQSSDERGPNDETTSTSSPDRASSRSDSCVPGKDFLRRCSPLDLLIGSILTVVLVTTVVALEITALIIYAFEFVFYRLADCCSPPNLATLWLYSIVGLLYGIFAMIDSILLLVSVGISELVAAMQFCLSFCFGGCSFAGRWHQSLRRTAHLIRVWFWFRFPCKNPKRHVFGKSMYAIFNCSRENVDGNCNCNDLAEEQHYTALVEASPSSDESEPRTTIQSAIVYCEK
jgi:hypothetical protein